MLVSVGSSVAFGAIYFVTPMLAPASAEALWGIRNLVTLPLVALALIMVRQWYLVTELGKRLRRSPALILGVIACGILVGLQLWVFSYAPLNGRGLQVALGYFLLPLVLVVVGRFLYKDRLVWWQWLAAGIAAAGVTFELIRVGEISWETLLVCIGYPVYFVLRRALGFAHLGGMFWEFAMLVPLAVICVAIELQAGTTLAANPALVWITPLFAVASALALMLYISASRLLTISMFGLLSYIEPALLVIASLLNGERILPAETVIYGAIWLAVLVLVIGGVVKMRNSRRGLGEARGSSG